MSGPWPRQAQRLAKRILPASTRRWIVQRHLQALPPVGLVRFGGLRRLTPVSLGFGFDRGTPVDRYYIEQFLAARAGDGDVRGRVLEIGDDRYARQFEASSRHRVASVDVLDVDASNEQATIVADLASAEHVPSDSFDCIICTQVLLLVYDVTAAIRTLHRILAPGGVLLLTLPGISKLCREEAERVGDYWRFTSFSVRRLLDDVFRSGEVTVEVHGNVLAAVAFLHGLAAEELTPRELDSVDEDFQVTIAARARKADRETPDPPTLLADPARTPAGAAPESPATPPAPA